MKKFALAVLFMLLLSVPVQAFSLRGVLGRHHHRSSSTARASSTVRAHQVSHSAVVQAPAQAPAVSGCPGGICPAPARRR